MAPRSRYGFPSLIAIFLLFLSLFNLTISTPLPDNHLEKREPTNPISQDRYEEYLKKYFPATDKYLFYSGGSTDQVKAFMEQNSGYTYYDAAFSSDDEQNHPWYKFFDKNKDLDDAEASSRALAAVASGDVLVFGAIEYKTAGKESFFTLHEVSILHEGIRNGRIKSIVHMAKGATSPDATNVMATEDADGNFAWKNGYKEGDKNASGAYGSCPTTTLAGRTPKNRARAEPCDAPKPNPKVKETPNPPDPPEDPRSLQIVREQVLCAGGPACDLYSWKFMEGKPGTAVDPCGSPIIPKVELDGRQAADDKFPNGSFNMRFQGYAEDCHYKGVSGEVGLLLCPGRPDVKCIESVEYASGDYKDCDGWGTGAIPVAFCDWE